MRFLKIPGFLLLVGTALVAFTNCAPRPQPGQRQVELFLAAKLKGGDVSQYCYGRPREAMNPALLDGLIGYKIVGTQWNQWLVEVQFSDCVERFRLHILHGLVGRIDRDGEVPTTSLPAK